MALSRERLINGFERDMIVSREVVQLVVQVNPLDVPEIIQKIQHQAVGLRLHQKENRLVLTPNKLYPVQKLPQFLKSPKEAAAYISNSMPFNFNETLAFVSANDNLVSFTASHSICDGTYLSNLLRSLSQKPQSNLNEPDDHNPNIDFPIQFTEIFKNEIDNYKQNNIKLNNFPNQDFITRFNWAKKPVNTFDTTTKAGYIEFVEPASSFLCYDKSKQKTSSFTEIQWSSLILSAECFNRLHNHAYNNFLHKTIGCSTCIEMKQFIPKNIASNIHNFGNFFICGNILCKDFSPDMTLKEMAQGLRKFYTEMKSNGLIFDTLYSMYDGYPKNEGNVIPFGVMQTSNVGPQFIEKPILDFWMEQRQPAMFTDFGTCLLSYGIKGKDRDDIVMRLRYSPRTIDPDHAKTLTLSTKFLMTNIPQSEIVQNAMKELEKFQKST